LKDSQGIYSKTTCEWLNECAFFSYGATCVKVLKAETANRSVLFDTMQANSPSLLSKPAQPTQPIKEVK